MAGQTRFNLSEAFVSVQGEGLQLGTPAIFVRARGCNLDCCWGGTPCDTRYASQPEADDFVPLTTVLARVHELAEAHPQVRQAVLTGGEPLLQQALPELMQRLKADGFELTLETNGTQFKELAVDFVSLSPKLASSTPAARDRAADHDRNRRRPEVLRRWVAGGWPYQLKFVVHCPADEDEILQLLPELGEVPPERVVLMPQGVDPEQLRRHAGLCVQMAIRRGWRYSPRAHIDAGIA